MPINDGYYGDSIDVLRRRLFACSRCGKSELSDQSIQKPESGVYTVRNEHGIKVYTCADPEIHCTCPDGPVARITNAIAKEATQW